MPARKRRPATHKAPRVKKVQANSSVTQLLIAPYHGDPPTLVAAAPTTTIAQLKRQVHAARVMLPGDRVELYTDRTMTMEYKEDFTLGDYGLADGATLVLAPVCMADTPVPVVDAQGRHMPSVLPPDAVGHHAPCGRVIVAYDYDTTEFIVSGGDTVTVNKLHFDGPLRPPPCELGHRALAHYGQCMIGEVKVLRVAARHVVVRNASGRTLAMLPHAVQSLREECVLHDVRVIYNKCEGLVFPQLAVTGGIMNVVDQVLRYLRDERGLEAVGTLRVRRVGGLSIVEPLDRLPRLTGLVLKLETRLVAAKRVSYKRTSADSILVHSILLDELDCAPWLLPRHPAALWSLLFGDTDGVPPFDARQLRAPYALDADGHITITRKLPLVVVEVPKAPMMPDKFVSLVRSGAVRACENGEYVQRHARGWHKVTCTEDLHRKHFELEALHDEILPLGHWNIDTLIQGCPKVWFREIFGGAYDASTGTLHFV